MSEGTVGSWTAAEVAQWLSDEGFSEEWGAAFAQNEIDGEALKLLKDPALLNDMGVPKAVGARLKFWQKLDALTTGGAEPISETVTEPQAAERAPAAGMAPPAGPTTTTLGLSARAANPQSVSEAADVAGAAMVGPMRDAEVEKVVADQRVFIDRICELLADLDAKDRDVALLLDLKENLSRLFSVVVVGEFNAGKSSLINAILGSKFCQEGVVPTTATINMLRYGEGDEGGKIQRNTDYQELFLPSPILKQVTVVDTPGTNAIIKEQTRLTKGFVPQSDLVVFVTSAERPITETEGKLLQYISEWGKKVVMVLNKIDLFEDEESLEKVKAFVRENAANILGVEPPVFGVAGRLALQAKLGMADPAADQAYAQELWARSRFADLEGYIQETLSDRKVAVKLKLETPLGVSEKFLANYKKASQLGGAVTEDDKQVLVQLKASMEAFDADVEVLLREQTARIDTVLGQVQQRARAATSSILSPQYIAQNLPGCLTKSGPIDAELRRTLDVDIDAELARLTADFGRALKDKQAAQWSLCSALISQRLQSRQWKDIVLAKPSVERASQILAGEGEGDGVAGAVPRASFDPQVETRLLGASLTQKAFDSAVATAAVGAVGLVALEVFNAAALDLAAFVLTAGGLFYSLGVYPSLLQDEVLGDLEQRAESWKGTLKEDVAATFKAAASAALDDMEQSFAPYTDAVAVEADKWDGVRRRVAELDADLQSIRSRLDSL